MSKVYKRGKNYYYTVNINGEQVRRSTGLSSKKAAEAFADEEIARIKLANARGYDADQTLDGAALSYMESGKDTRFIGKLVEAWGHMRIRDMKPEWIRQNAQSIYPKAKAATLNRQVITPVQAIINHAYQMEDGRKIAIKRLDVSDVKQKEAVDTEWHEKFRAAAGDNIRIASLARFMFETATRISEALRVMPDDVDLDAREVVLGRTKTQANGRTTYISAELAEMLREVLELPLLTNKNDSSIVFGIFGYQDRTRIYGPWKTICKRAGISYSPPHSSGRVSFATETVVRRGIDPRTAADAGGWATPRMLMDVYAKSDKSRRLVDEVFSSGKSTAHSQHTPVDASSDLEKPQQTQ